jgi:TP901 family phage tail tape measure protein
MAAGQLTLGGIKYEIIAEDQTKSGTDSATDNLKKVDDQALLTTANLAKVTAAFAAITAISAGLVAASDRVVNLERITAQAAVTQGVSTRAMYEYVQGLSSASDPQEEVGATMAYLSRTGLKMSDDLTSVYQTMDLIGDATGSTSTAMSQQLIPAFQSLGMTAQDVAKYADLLAYAVNHSLFEISDWSMMLRRNGQSLLEFNVPLEDTIAIMMKLAELGIPALKIRTILNEAFKDMGANAEIAKKGEEDLIVVQDKLTEAQTRYNKSLDDGEKSRRHMVEDLQNAGSDVGAARRIIQAYNSSETDRAESNAQKTSEWDIERNKLTKERDDLQAQITAAKNAPIPTLPEAIAKQLPNQVTTKELTDSIAKAKTGSVGEAVKRQAPGEIVTGSEIAAYNVDQIAQGVGKAISPEQAASLMYIRDISGAMTVVSGLLTMIQGFSQTTAIMTTASALGGGIGAPAILAGLGIGLAGVGLMEATGITSLTHEGTGKQGLIEQAGAATGQYVKNAGKTVGAAAIDAGKATGQMIVNIQNVNLSKDYPVNSFMDDLRNQRQGMGIRVSQ